jgi:cyclic beta-1,2-glucan synthetase
MVIMPTMLDSVAQIEELLAHIEVQALGNVDPHIHFALLTDFRDATSETLPRDAEMLAAAADGIRALNARHATGSRDRFFLFHRQRQWNDGEGLWMGWERKRGKIEEFNRLLRGAVDTTFVDYLIGNGRRQFERSVAWVPRPMQRLRRNARVAGEARPGSGHHFHHPHRG